MQSETSDRQRGKALGARWRRALAAGLLLALAERFHELEQVDAAVLGHRDLQPGGVDVDLGDLGAQGLELGVDPLDRQVAPAEQLVAGDGLVEVEPGHAELALEIRLQRFWPLGLGGGRGAAGVEHAGTNLERRDLGDERLVLGQLEPLE